MQVTGLLPAAGHFTVKLAKYSNFSLVLPEKSH